jgi:putative NADH-flavin reductase
MKLAILGATGPSGVQLVKEALERGHDVTAIVRNPDKLTEKHDKLKVS